MGKTSRKYKKRDDVAATVAKIKGLSYRYVQMVRDGEREDEEVMAMLVEYTQGKTALIKSLEKIVKITPNPKRYARQKN
jgi:hypothetical protein